SVGEPTRDSVCVSHRDHGCFHFPICCVGKTVSESLPGVEAVHAFYPRFQREHRLQVRAAPDRITCAAKHSVEGDPWARIVILQFWIIQYPVTPLKMGLKPADSRAMQRG